MNPTISVRIRTTTTPLGDELERIVAAAGGFRLLRADEKARPDLLIYELGENVDEACKGIQLLLESNGVGEVFVTAAHKDADLLLKAMRAGAKEFISQPLDEAEVQAALLAFKKRVDQAAKAAPVQEPAHAGQIINVMGAKGGVGTTTVAVNLAMTLAGKKKAGAVALVDQNAVFGEIPLFLSVTPTYHWGQIVKNINRLDGTFLLNAMARHPSGVHILPSPSYLNGHPPATAEIMERLLTTMRRTFDYIVVDGGQSLDGPALKVIGMADRVLLITLLNLPCLHNTGNLLKSLTGTGAAHRERIDLVINRYLKKSDITLKEAEESVHREIFWHIPNDYKTSMSAINRGKPLCEIAPKAEITRKIEDLADVLIHGERKEKKKGWFFGR
jgi:pilus assembly protein CpaE